MINTVANNLSMLDDSVKDNKNICFITILNDLLPIYPKGQCLETLGEL